MCAAAEGLELRALALELKRVRLQGYAVGGRLPSTQAVSAPIFRGDGTVIGSVSVVMPEARFTPEVKRFCVEQIVKVGRAISREIGTDASARRQARR